MNDQPGLKGHTHHWYASDADQNRIWWSCAGCDESKQTASAAQHLNNAIAAAYANAGPSAIFVDIRKAMELLDIPEAPREWEHWNARGDQEWLT